MGFASLYPSYGLLVVARCAKAGRDRPAAI